MKMNTKLEGKYPAAQHVCEWSASRSGRCTTEERANGTHWTREWVWPRTSLDWVAKGKIPFPARNL